MIQDFKSRSVYWFVFPVLLLAFLALQCKQQIELVAVWHPALINIAFLILQFLLLSAYFSLKNKRLINILDQMLGLGDILFLICLTVYLPVLNFLIFYILSLVVALICWAIWQFFAVRKDKEIPLAGMQAMLLMVLLIGDWWLKILNLTDDNLLLNLIAK
ncbi:hypothetical protein ACPPVU_12635 [Mucilaginibacter sp. McL0603]|uniref:hypothetical protein n=1 Tax=Mucilaginibacter sp. McL0603 TaxID=3415670 RepID=UPI003CF77D2E